MWGRWLCWRLCPTPVGVASWLLLLLLSFRIKPRMAHPSRPDYSHNSTCCVTTRHARCAVRIAPCMFQQDGRRRSSSARVYKFSLFGALYMRQSEEQLLAKVRWSCPPQSTLWRHPWTRVARVAPVALVVTSKSRRAVRQAWQETSRLFPMPKHIG